MIKRIGDTDELQTSWQLNAMEESVRAIQVKLEPRKSCSGLGGLVHGDTCTVLLVPRVLTDLEGADDGGLHQVRVLIEIY